MPEGRQSAARAQDPCGLGDAGDRVDPVPGRSGGDDVEGAAVGVPRLERRLLDVEPAPASEGGHARVGLDTQHGAAGGQELARGGAGAAADVEDVAARAGGDDPLDQGVRVGGPGAVVTFGIDPEGLGHLPLPVGVRDVLGGGRGRTAGARRRSGHAPTINGQAPTMSIGTWVRMTTAGLMCCRLEWEGKTGALSVGGWKGSAGGAVGGRAEEAGTRATHARRGRVAGALGSRFRRRWMWRA